MNSPVDAKPKFKALWAVDAFEERPEVLTEAISLFECLARHCELSVEPIYILSPDQLGMTVEFLPPWIEHYVPLARKQLEQKLKAVSLPGLMAPQILTQPNPSLRTTVGTLNHYATSKNFDLLVLGSHGRSGFGRALLGSFAEEIVLQTQKSVLVIGANAESRPIQQIPSILFPTDFADESSLDDVLDLAKKLGARINLLHCTPKPAATIFQSGAYLLTGAWTPLAGFLEQEQTRQREVAESWKARAKHRGVELVPLLDSNSFSIVDSILTHTESSEPTLVAMASHSGRLKSSLIGSICRQVLRKSRRPVWVLRKPT